MAGGGFLGLSRLRRSAWRPGELRQHVRGLALGGGAAAGDAAQARAGGTGAAGGGLGLGLGGGGGGVVLFVGGYGGSLFLGWNPPPKKKQLLKTLLVFRLKPLQKGYPQKKRDPCCSCSTGISYHLARTVTAPEKEPLETNDRRFPHGTKMCLGSGELPLSEIWDGSGLPYLYHPNGKTDGLNQV